MKRAFVPKIILASKSPIRKVMLQELNIPFEVIVSNADETPTEELSFEKQLQEISMRKAQVVLEKTTGKRIIVAADQNIVFDGKMYGKPATIEEARTLIKSMIGSNEIYAYVGNAIIYADEYNQILKIINNCDISRMSMDCVEDGAIENYLTYGSPLDKCGGINIDVVDFLHLQEGRLSTARGMTTEFLQQILES